MTLSFPPRSFAPCPECGVSVLQAAAEHHVCEPERRLDAVMAQLRSDVDQLDREVGAYLDSPAGRFEQWDAARRRRPAA